MSQIAKCCFNGGEISELGEQRTDLEVVRRSTRVMLDFAAQVQGGAVRHSGTIYLGDLIAEGGLLLAPFAFNLDYIYLLEFGGKYVRIWRNDALIRTSVNGNLITNGEFSTGLTSWTIFKNGSTSPEHDSAAGKAILYGTDYKNTGNISGIYQDIAVTPGEYILDLNQSSHKLAHSTEDRYRLYAGLVDQWSTLPAPGSLNPATFPNWIGGNAPGKITVPSGVSGTKRLALFFDSASSIYVDDIVLQRNEGALVIETPYAAADLSRLRLHSIGDEIYITHPNYQTRILSRTGVNTFALNKFVPEYPPFRLENKTAVTIQPSATTGDAITITASSAMFTANHVGVQLEIYEAQTVNSTATEVIGRLEILSITSATVATAKVLPNPSGKAQLPSTTATKRWAESAWNNLYGYPAVSCQMHDRLIMGSTPFSPGDYWLSEKKNFKSFAAGSDATASIARSLPDDHLNLMLWMKVYATGVAIGTAKGEYLINSGSSEAAWTVDTVRATKVSNYGSSATVGAIDADSDLMFVQIKGEILRRFAQELSDTEEQYFSLLSVYAEHLTRKDPIISMAFAGPPYQCVFAVTRSGRQIAMTYQKEHKVFGWWQPNSGTAEGVVVLPGADGDSVYWAIRRMVGGKNRLCLEKQVEPFDGKHIDQAFFVACGKKLSGSGLLAISGLGHLEGSSVDVVADGVYQGVHVVSGGSVPITEAADTIVAGLPLDCRMHLLPIDYIDDKGTYVGDLDNISEVSVFLAATGEGLLVSGTGQDDDWVNFPDIQRGQLFKGKVRTTLKTKSDDGSLIFKMATPLPVNILKVVYHIGG